MNWKVRTYYKKDLANSYLGQIRVIRDHLRKFLGERDYKVVYQTEVITDSSGSSFDFHFDYVGNVLEISITSENWKAYTKTRYPQIVLLIEDYFKSNIQFWYYLETLDNSEIENIKLLKRDIDPLKIKKYLELIEINQSIPKPDLEKEGEYKYQQTDLYSGSVEKHSNLVGFWISFLSWIWNADIEYSDLNYFLEKGWFDTFHGSCIPKTSEELIKEISIIKKEIDWFEKENIKQIYLMRKDWNDCIYLFDLENQFIIYNWWTSE